MAILITTHGDSPITWCPLSAVQCLHKQLVNTDDLHMKFNRVPPQSQSMWTLGPQGIYHAVGSPTARSASSAISWWALLNWKPIIAPHVGIFSHSVSALVGCDLILPVCESGMSPELCSLFVVAGSVNNSFRGCLYVCRCVLRISGYLELSRMDTGYRRAHFLVLSSHCQLWPRIVWVYVVGAGVE